MLSNQRRTGIDLGKVVACFSVIIIHATSSSYEYWEYAANALNQLARWAVPFFFFTSGYLINLEMPWFRLIVKYAIRLLPVFLFWCALYLIINDEPFSYLDTPGKMLKLLLNGGPGHHLWFLPALGICICLSVIAIRFLSTRVLTVVAVIFYFLALLGGSYEAVFFSQDVQEKLPNTRNGPFFGLIFVVLGILVRKRGITPSPQHGLVLMLFGVFISTLEIAFLNIAYDVPLTRHDFVLGTVPFGVGAAFFFLGFELRSTRARRIVSEIGLVSLGIYAIHLMILDEIEDWFQFESALAGVALAGLIMVISTTVSLAGARVPVMRRVFS